MLLRQPAGKDSDGDTNGVVQVPKEKLIVRHKCALGDTVVLTALLRDIELAYPGRFDLYVDANVREVLVGNPYAKIATEKDMADGRSVLINYQKGITDAGHGVKIHMLRAFHRDFNEKTGLDVRVTLPRPDLRLLADNVTPIVEGDYWLIVAGSKVDVTIKQWRPSHWQAVVDGLTARGIRVVQAGVNFKRHANPTLKGVVDLVNKYPDARSLLNLVKHAQGVICPITAAMHIAAAFERPCVVVGGGREEPWWEGYTNEYPGSFGEAAPPVAVPHAYLHTVGQMDCCLHKGCWKHRVRPLHDGANYDGTSKLCNKPAVDGIAAQCMDRVTPDAVLAAVDAQRGVTVPPAAVPLVPLTVIQKPEIESPPPQAPYLIDHPIIGGRMTVFALCYGAHPQLARKCLGSILRTIPRDRIDLRVALADACPQTKQYVHSVAPDAVYDAPDNPGKYVLMRRMFHDPDRPVTTPYLAWFDDDTSVVDGSMWNQLCNTIVSNHPHGSRMYGTVMQHDLAAYRSHDARTWFRQARWYQGKHFRVRGTQTETPAGTAVQFAVGWFWAMHSGLIQAADVPCERLRHNGGDITIGEMVHQAGAKIKQFNPAKSLVSCPSREAGGRRGMSHAFPWSLP